MSDIGLFWSSDLAAADLEISGDDLTTDDGLETAVMLSLFTDRRAEESDQLPTAEKWRRGWWADAHPVVEGDKFGSRLWLLARSKSTADVPVRAKEYALEALAWMIEDQISDRVDVESEIVDSGILALQVSIYRPEADTVKFRYHYTWAAQAARRA